MRLRHLLIAFSLFYASSLFAEVKVEQNVSMEKKQRKSAESRKN